MKLQEALEIVIAELDRRMEEAPTRQIAEISNYLEELKAEL